MRKATGGQNNMGDIQEAFNFVKGLKEKLRRKVTEREPEDLDQAVRMAKAIDRAQKNKDEEKLGFTDIEAMVKEAMQGQNKPGPMYQEMTKEKGEDEMDKLTRKMKELEIKRMERQIQNMERQLNDGAKNYNNNQRAFQRSNGVFR
jgi:hypothetical protein